MSNYGLVKVERHEGNVTTLVRVLIGSKYSHPDASHHRRCHPRHYHNCHRFRCEGNAPLVSVCLNLLLFNALPCVPPGCCTYVDPPVLFFFDRFLKKLMLPGVDFSNYTGDWTIHHTLHECEDFCEFYSLCRTFSARSL